MTRTLLAILICCSGVQAAPLTGRVVSVSDGDTCTVEVKIRLHYVDAPELKQPHGVEAKDHAKELLLGRTIEFTPVGKSYDRTVADVQLGGIDLARHLVERGEVMVDPRFKPPAVLLKAQDDAKAERSGIWRVPEGTKPEPPWEFRKRKKQK